MSAGGVADAGKLDHVRIDAAPRLELSAPVAASVATDHQRFGIIRLTPEQVDRDRIGLSLHGELQLAGELAVVVASPLRNTQDGSSARSRIGHFDSAPSVAATRKIERQTLILRNPAALERALNVRLRHAGDTKRGEHDRGD